MTNQTPRVASLPWRVKKTNAAVTIVSANGYDVADVTVFPSKSQDWQGISRAEAEANAALIVAAVNACDALNQTAPMAIAVHLVEVMQDFERLLTNFQDPDKRLVNLALVRASMQKMILPSRRKDLPPRPTTGTLDSP